MYCNENKITTVCTCQNKSTQLIPGLSRAVYFRLGLTLLLLLFLGQLNLQAQQEGYASNPINRDCPRFQDEVFWLNRLARNYQKNYPIDLMFVGDSITQSWDTVGKSVWDKYYGNRRVFNFGISGDQTGHVLWRLENAPLFRIAPKATVVLIGTNNPGSPDDTANGIKKIVTTINKKFPETKVLLLEVFPRGKTADSDARKRVQAINVALRQKCAGMNNVTLLNFEKQFIESDGSISGKTMHDYLHLTPEGFELWAKTLESELEKVIGPIPANPPECSAIPREEGRFNEKNNIIKKGNIDVLMIGDSITHYWERPEGVPQWKELFKDVTAVNLGIGWDRTENVIWRIQHYDFSNVSPKAAFVLIGVNNSLVGSPVNIAKGNRKICQILHEKFPKMKIYVQKVLPWGNNDLQGKNEVRHQINQEIEKAVSGLDQVQILDLSSCFLTPDGKLNPETFNPDLVHLSAKGYENWRNAIQKYVNEAKK